MAKKTIKKWDSYIADNGELYMICANSEEGGETFKGKYWLGNLCYKYTATSGDATGVVCPECSTKLIGPPEIKIGRQSSGRPRGWQFMKEYVDKDGTVFHKGIEKPNLKGTIDSTEIKIKNRPNKQQKKQILNIALKNIISLKKILKKDAATKKEKARLESQIRKFNRIASGKLPRNFDFEDFIAN